MNTKLNCLLIAPPVSYEDDKNIWKGVNSNFPPLGIASIASYIRAKGKSVRIIDCNIECSSVESFAQFFKSNITQEYSEVDIIGITVLTCTVNKAYEIAEICKGYYPHSKIVFGGAHATFVFNEVIRNQSVDIIVCGEGEITLNEILDNIPLEKVKGIVYKNNNSIIQNLGRERILNLDEIPMPAYDLLPILRYRPAKGAYRRLPAMSMLTSRGCPGRCTFCSKVLGNRIVFKSAKGIYEEILYLIKNYGIKEILFYDDTFTVNRKNIIELCDMLIKNKVDISWTCFARVDFVDYEMLGKMKRAGCHQIMYGVENIDEGVLKNINKKINLQQVINAVKWTKKAKIECRLAFMVGNPGDTKEIVQENIKFVNRLNPDLAIFNVATPFPGTEMFNWARERNLILTYNWDDYTLAKPVMRLENLTEVEIKELYRLMYRSFYMRLSYMFGKLLKIRSKQDILTLLNGLIAVVSFLKIVRCRR